MRNEADASGFYLSNLCWEGALCENAVLRSLWAALAQRMEWECKIQAWILSINHLINGEVRFALTKP
ncbi:hypothetical protein VNO77_29458 [Canavalia gladiata]|uniref:Uncharacterized protein n=1 Tax=Canavalia gladiata TaxID=3824 RepID=A0AAN9L1J4_CANGL